MADAPPHRWLVSFVSGVAAGAAGTILVQALAPRRGFDVRLLGDRREGVPPVVIVPGLLGCELLRPDGARAWLNVGNALGYHHLSLPLELPLGRGRDRLVPGDLLGADRALPRLFGFTEYADLIELVESAGFVRDSRLPRGHQAYHIFSYDWRRDLVESARRLHDTLDELADAAGDPHARFNLVAHSMGGLVARYFLRYGRSEPGGPVTWAGAGRVGSLALAVTPSGGSVHALGAILSGQRVGLSATTLAAPVIGSMPAMYQILPPRGVSALLDHRLDPIRADLFAVGTWRGFGWGPFAPGQDAGTRGPTDDEAVQAHLGAALDRAARFHDALARRPESPCPVRVTLLGGDCFPTLARAVVPEAPGSLPRLDPQSPREAEALLEAGDGRVTRASVLATHLPEAALTELECGIPEVSGAFLGSADHHGIYAEPTFQSLLLRLLLRPAPGARRRPGPSDGRPHRLDSAIG